MPKLLNKSARLVTIPFRAGDISKVAHIRRIAFPPLQLVTVSREDWAIIKEVYLVKKMLDEGTLIEGAKAGREAVDADTIKEELAKDLTEEELERVG